MPENQVRDYILGEPVGESEFYCLYKAEHTLIKGRFCAIKMPQVGSERFPLVLLQQALKQIFVHMCDTAVGVAQACDAADPIERDALRNLETIKNVHYHPDLELDSDRPYILSEWVVGESLAERLAQGPLSVSETVAIMTGALEGLAFLHSRNIFHGNLKPGNILLTDKGVPVLTDFGGNLLEGGRPIRLGSVPYLSPEQIAPLSEAGPKIDGRSDLFSLTLILYEMLTGKRPGSLLTPGSMPSALNASVALDFDELIVQGLQTDPEQRFRSPLAMRERLQQAAEGRRTPLSAGIIGISMPAAESMEPTAVASLLDPEPKPVIEVKEPDLVPSPPPLPVMVQRPAGESRKNARDGAEMIWVPGGVLLMGGMERDEEQPIHEVTVGGFWLYRFPVTQGLYLPYMTATSVRRPGMWKRGTEHAGKPVTGLNWQEANDYARWAGGRLPSEAEWEWAARGPTGRRYPWGDTWDQRCANTRERGEMDVTDVADSLSGTSWCKAVDMLGNTNEWCSSLYRPYPYDAEDGREDAYATGGRVLRGGSAISSSDRVYAAYRTSPNASTTLTGFRLAISEE